MCGPVTDWRIVHGVPRSHAMTAGIGSSFPPDPERDRALEGEDEFILFRLLSHFASKQRGRFRQGCLFMSFAMVTLE